MYLTSFIKAYIKWQLMSDSFYIELQDDYDQVLYFGAMAHNYNGNRKPTFFVVLA